MTIVAMYGREYVLSVAEEDALAAARPREVLVFDNVTLRRQPPIVGDYCSVPRSGRASWPCGYRATTCNEESRKCGRCRFHYCGKHFDSHIRQILAPPDTWNRMMNDLNQQLRDIAASDKRLTPLRTPKPDFSETESEEPDAETLPA